MMILSAAGNFFLLAHVDGFRGTPVEAGEAGGTVIADHCFAIHNGNIVHGADSGTDAAADTVILCRDSTEIIRIIHGGKGKNLLDTKILYIFSKKRSNRFCNVMVLGIQIGLIHFRRIQKTVAGHLDTRGIGQLLAAGAEQLIQPVGRNTHMTPAGSKGEQIGGAAEYHFGNGFPHGVCHIAIIHRKDKADSIRIDFDFTAVFYIDYRDNLAIIKIRSKLLGSGLGVARCGKIEQDSFHQ